MHDVGLGRLHGVRVVALRLEQGGAVLGVPAQGRRALGHLGLGGGERLEQWVLCPTTGSAYCSRRSPPAKAEVAKCATALRWYAENGPALLEPQRYDADAVKATEAYVVHQPLGVVLAVMPWNFPLWQVMRFAAPALMAGNVGLLKHASQRAAVRARTSRTLFRRAGFPDGVLPDAAHRVRRGRAGARDAAGRGRHADRQRTPRAGRSPRSPATRSRRRCSSSAAATRSS